MGDLYPDPRRVMGDTIMADETDSSDVPTVELPERPLAEHVMFTAYEGPHDEHVNTDIEYDLYDAHKNIVHVDEIDDGDGRVGLLVVAEIDGTASRRTARATRWHPAEYERRDVPIVVEATWFPRDGLHPDTHLRVTQEGEAFGRPDPEPYDL